MVQQGSAKRKIISVQSAFWHKQNCLDSIAIDFEYNLATMTRVKVCGITTPDDACLAAEYGADAVGLVFAESSRKVSVEEAWEIAAVLPDGVLKVGVFVDAQPATVLRVAAEIGLDYAQLHGDESPEVVAAVRDDGLKVMKAFRVRGAASLEALRYYEADLFLLDTYSERLQGGTGERFDWVLAKSLKGRGNIVISGGLTPENVREAIRFFEPYGVDASSSLEDSPGKKNAERVRRFVSAAKG
jgi:phosphoribosylanthranilate isomerase